MGNASVFSHKSNINICFKYRSITKKTLWPCCSNFFELSPASHQPVSNKRRKSRLFGSTSSSDGNSTGIKSVLEETSWMMAFILHLLGRKKYLFFLHFQNLLNNNFKKHDASRSIG